MAVLNIGVTASNGAVVFTDANAGGTPQTITAAAWAAIVAEVNGFNGLNLSLAIVPTVDASGNVVLTDGAAARLPQTVNFDAWKSMVKEVLRENNALNSAGK